MRFDDTDDDDDDTDRDDPTPPNALLPPYPFSSFLCSM